MSDTMIVKVLLPTNGLESTQTKKFKTTATLQEVVDTVKLSLHPCLQPCAFLLKKKSGGFLSPEATIGSIGLQREGNLYTGIYMLPVDYKEMKRLLDENAAISERKSPSGNMFALSQQVVKSGYLLVKHGQKRSSYKRRWCVLRESSLLLFSSPKDSEAVHVIDLAHGRVSFTLSPSKTCRDYSNSAMKPPSPNVAQRTSPLVAPMTPPSGSQASSNPVVISYNRRSNSQNGSGLFVPKSLATGSGQVATNPQQGTNPTILLPTTGNIGGSSASAFTVDSSGRKGTVGEVPFLEFVSSDNDFFYFSAESFDDAQSWVTAITSGKSDTVSSNCSAAEEQIRNSSVSCYTMRKTRSGGNVRKFAVLVKTQLMFFDSPVDTEPPETLDLFAQRIVYDTEKNEIEISSLGDEMTTMTFNSEQEFSGWVSKLREVLPEFVSEREPETVDLRTSVVKQGWMLVKNTSKRFSTQKKRWCAIKDKKLFFLHSPKETKVLGVVDLIHTQASFFETESINGRSNDQRIDIITAGASYCLRLADANPDPTKHELKDWCDVIQSNCVGKAFNVVHKQHVDFDFNWTVGDPRDLFEFRKKIGAGAFASVYCARHKESGFDIAIKILRIKASTALSLKQEIDVLKTCHSPQIMSYFGTCQLPNQLWILTEFCKCGSLKDLMKTTFETLNEAQLAFTCMETLRGLCYLHSKDILHLDVKAGNLLLTEEGAVKLADFGVSQQLRGTDKIVAENYIGSPLYMSPEVLRKSVYGAKTDVWSLGITIIELAEGQPPNMGVTSFDVLLKRHLRAPPRLTTPAGWSAKLNSFIAQCLVLDAEERASPVDLLMHPFLNPRQDQSCMLPLVHLCLSMRKDSDKATVIIPEELRDSQVGLDPMAKEQMLPVALQEGQKNPLLTGNIPRVTPLQMALNSQIVSLRKTDDPDAHLIRPQDSIGPSSPRSPVFVGQVAQANNIQPSPLRENPGNMYSPEQQRIRPPVARTSPDQPSSGIATPEVRSDRMMQPTPLNLDAVKLSTQQKPQMVLDSPRGIAPPATLPHSVTISPQKPPTVSGPLVPPTKIILPVQITQKASSPSPSSPSQGPSSPSSQQPVPQQQPPPPANMGVPIPKKPISSFLAPQNTGMSIQNDSDGVGTPFDTSFFSETEISPGTDSMGGCNTGPGNDSNNLPVLNFSNRTSSQVPPIVPPPQLPASVSTQNPQQGYIQQAPMSPLSFSAYAPTDDYGY